ncbi:hypothetical protein KW95_15150 [Clostridioides difficile]|nr:hypothetical protein KW95_15150 [Clostridioides difficile]
MNKKNKIFLLITLLVSIFIILPKKSFSQENNCLDDFKNWIVKNEDNKGDIVYILTCDMVIDNYFGFSVPNGANVTIDTNQYKILIKDKGNFNISGNKLNIIGEGGNEGVIHVERGGKLNIGIDNIVALNGTALYIEKEAELVLATYYGKTGNIRASGDNAIGIYSENDIKVESRIIEVNGKDAVGIYCNGDVEIEDTSVIVNKNNQQNTIANNTKGESIVSKTKIVYIIGDGNVIMPDIPQDEDYNIIRCNLRGISVFEEELILTKDDKIEDVELPKEVSLKTSSGKIANINVEWDLLNYYTDLNKNLEFIIRGKFDENILNEKNIVLNQDVFPVINISIRNKEPINNLVVYFRNREYGYTAALDYDMPYNAKKVFVEYSDDGINWISNELEYITNQATIDFEDFKLRCFRVKVEGGLRDGYSNIFLKPGFVLGGGNNQITPDDEQENENAGGDRGGGGRDDPDREEDNNGNLNNDNKDNNSSNDEKTPNTPNDNNIESDSSSTTSKNPPKDNDDNNITNDKEKDEILKNEDELKNEDKSNKSFILENDNKGLKQKTVFSTNNQSYFYNEDFYNDNLDMNNNQSKINNQVNHNNENKDEINTKLSPKKYSIGKESFILIGVLSLTMFCSILIVNPGTRKNIIRFIKIKK